MSKKHKTLYFEIKTESWYIKSKKAANNSLSIFLGILTIEF